MVRQSATLAINERVQARRAAGKEVLHLGFGEAGLPVLPEVREVFARSAQYNSYGPVMGALHARAAAAHYFARRGLPTGPEQIMLAPGSKALLFGMLAVLPGDVVLPQPSWVSYAAQAALVGKAVINVPIPPDTGGVPDPELLDAALTEASAKGQRPGCLVLTLPDNPTGTVPSPDLVGHACKIAERHGLVVISDEIYRDLSLRPEQFSSPVDFLPERAVITSGLSKNMALGGYRIGYARLPEGRFGRRLYEDLSGLASEVWSSMAAPMQEVLAWVLDEPAAVTAHIEASRRLHGTVVSAVRDAFVAAGATCRMPGGAFYLYPDLEAWRCALANQGVRTSGQLAEALLDQYGVGVLAGEEFGDEPTALRLRVATSLLYGDDEEQRWEALRSPDPLALPWISSALTRLQTVLADLGSGTTKHQGTYSTMD